MEEEQFENIQVLIRIKPPYMDNGQLSNAKSTMAKIDADPTSIVFLGTKNEVFTFDQIKWPDCQQEDFFESVGRCLSDSCLLGYNATIFAYGQTGSGKTFTMQGPYDDFGQLHPVHKGLIPRCFEYLFQQIKEQESRSCGKVKFFCKCSFVEIYNEMIFDLLDTNSCSGPCNLREDNEKGVFLEGNVYHPIECEYDAYKLFLDGTKNRTVAETSMNRESSRSHSVFTIYLQSRYSNGESTDIRESKFNMVDLAGSERQSMTATVGVRLKEAGNINKSLMSLGQVINALVDIGNGKQRHVPYRDSKLTFLLRDSLGGNTKTVIIANVNPLPSCAAESLSTLRFAQRAKLIRNNAIVNQDVLVSVGKLKQEIQRLEMELENQKLLNETLRREMNCTVVDSRMEIGEADAKNLTVNSWKEALSQISALRDEKAAALERVQCIEEMLTKKDEQLYSERMINKFKEQMYSVIDEKLISCNIDEATKAKIECLERELSEKERQYNNHPEVTKFAYENLCLQQDIQRNSNHDKHAKIEDNYISSLERNLSTVIHENEHLIRKCDELRLLTPDQEKFPIAQSENITDLKRSFKFAINATEHQIEEFKDAIHAKNNEFLLFKEEKQTEVSNLTAKLDLIREENSKNQEQLIFMEELKERLNSVITENAQYCERLAEMHESQEKLRCQSTNLAELLLKMARVERERDNLRNDFQMSQGLFTNFVRNVFEKLQFHSQKQNLFGLLVTKVGNLLQLAVERLFQLENVLHSIQSNQLHASSDFQQLQQQFEICHMENAKLIESNEALRTTNESLHSSYDDLQNVNESLKHSYKFANGNYQALMENFNSLYNSFQPFKYSIRNLWIQLNSLCKEREAEFSRCRGCCDLFRSDCAKKIGIICSIAAEYSKAREHLFKINEERLWYANEFQAVKQQSSETINLLDTELSQYKSGWSQMKDELRCLTLTVQQFKTQCSVMSEDNEQLVQEARTLRSKVHEYEQIVKKNVMHDLEEKIRTLDEALLGADKEITTLKEENERLIQHQNMKQKLQYHVKIKQENNELKEMLRQSREENSALRQKMRENVTCGELHQ